MININAIIYQMLATLTTAYGPKWDSVKSIAEETLADTKERLQVLAQAVISGEKTPAEAAVFLKEELQILESHLLAAAVIIESELQEAINKAIDVFAALVAPFAPKQ